MTRKVLVLCIVCVFAVPPAASAQTPDDVKATIAWVRKLQTPAGGFLAMEPKENAGRAPTLRATSSAVRALHYLRGNLTSAEACKNYVASCHDAETGGFKDTPQAKPDVFTTAVGIMAVVELKMPVERYGPGAIKYLSENAKGFEEIRIAAAGLERLGMSSPKNDEWLQEVRKIRIPGDRSAPDSGVARQLGSVVVTTLRLGQKEESSHRTVKVLQEGQRLNGGWGKHGTPASDLETTYRVMRAFMMLKAKPKDMEGVRSFVAKCRNADGGYGVAPGEDSTIGGTYFAAIIRHWLSEMKG